MYTLYHADCLDILPTLEAQSVDAVICDIPTGATDCEWDNRLDLNILWSALTHVSLPSAAIILFGIGSLKYAADVIASNESWFRYEWVWSKNMPTGHGYARFRPMRSHEYILVFCKAKEVYHPQMTSRTEQELKRLAHTRTKTAGPRLYSGMAYSGVSNRENSKMKYPRTILEFKCVHSQGNEKTSHTSQKPLTLLEYLVRTYTNEGDTVLDFTMGSGTTGHACANTGRRFVGIEKDRTYYDIASERIATAYEPLRAMQEVA